MDLILTRASVLTMARGSGAAEAIAVEDGKIRAVGDSADLVRRASPETAVVDLQGLTVCPGFIDGHNHFSPAAFEPMQVDCSTPPLEDLPSVLASIREYAVKQPPGSWLRGWGFNSSRVRERRDPTRWELDEVSPDNPFVLMNASYHACHVNSRALGLLGFRRHHPNPAGGEIVRDRAGEPTGTLLEAAMNVPHSTSWAEYIRRSPDDGVGIIEENCRKHLELGVTAVGDALVIPEASKLYRRAADAGRLPITIQQMFGGSHFFSPPATDQSSLRSMLDDHGHMLRGGMVKLFMDTAHPGPAMDHCEDGIPGAHTGRLYYPPSESAEIVKRATDAGLGVALHCLGNRAINQALDAFQQVRHGRRGDLPVFRIEHFIVASADQIRRAADLNVVLMMQPSGCASFGDAYATWRGDGRPHLRLVPMRALLDAGAQVAASSDYPCAPLPPIEGMWAATARVGPQGEPIDPDQAITPLEALRAYTATAAAAAGRESEEGTIEVGKRANLVVLDANPLETSVESLRQIRVLRTYVDGVCQYDRA